MRLTSDKRIFVPDCDDWYKWGADYEQKEYDEVIQCISKFDVALDIGAHVGIWSRRLAEKFKTVVAFEPVPSHIECWKKNMENFIKENSTNSCIFYHCTIFSSEINFSMQPNNFVFIS